MRTYVAKDVEITFGGHRLSGDGHEWTTLDRVAPFHPWRAPKYEVSVTVEVPDGQDLWLSLMFACGLVRRKSRAIRRALARASEPRGASFVTLMRRAMYLGGRKGRRAYKRLMALPKSVWRRELAD